MHALMAPKRIYVIGGRIIDEGRARATTQVYNPENDSWTFGASIITARFHLAIAVANDKLYAIGGYSFYQSIPPQITCEENEQYTPIGYGTVPQHSEPFPTTLIVATTVIVAVVGAALLVYSLKVKKTIKPKKTREV